MHLSANLTKQNIMKQDPLKITQGRRKHFKLGRDNSKSLATVHCDLGYMKYL